MTERLVYVHDVKENWQKRRLTCEEVFPILRSDLSGYRERMTALRTERGQKMLVYLDAPDPETAVRIVGERLGNYEE